MYDIPNVIHGIAQDYKKLYYSDRNIALTLEKTLQAGYGLLEAGTIMAENLSAGGGDGKLVPYNPTAFTGTEVHPGRAYLVANVTGASGHVQDVYMTLEDSYKFEVGDDLIINDDDTAAENLGAITAIDRTTYSHMAKITPTAEVGNSVTFLTANFAYVCVEAGISANNYSDAVAILDKAVDTGTGALAKGAFGVIVVSNAILYTGLLVNTDAAAKVDLSYSEVGRFTILK